MARCAIFLIVDGLLVRTIRAGEPVTIGALQLHGSIGSAQILLQMYPMIEFDSAWVRHTGPQYREFRMAVIEAANVGRELRSPVRGRQIRMTLRAGAIAGAGQPQRALMFHVAVRTGRREGLVRMMDGAIVASKARLIGGVPLKARLRDMTRIALLS